MILDPLISTILLSGGIFAVSFMIGRNSKPTITFEETTSIIDRVIEELCRDGYIHYYMDENDEMEIMTIAEFNERMAKEHNDANSKEKSA